jgi:hypothetical protein
VQVIQRRLSDLDHGSNAFTSPMPGTMPPTVPDPVAVTEISSPLLHWQFPLLRPYHFRMMQWGQEKEFDSRTIMTLDEMVPMTGATSLYTENPSSRPL